MNNIEGFMEIIALHRQGFSTQAMARKLGVHGKTVKKYIESSSMPMYSKTKRQVSILDPYRQVIDDYLAEDGYQATWIYDRLQKQGYQDSYKIVLDYVRSVKERRHRLAYSRFEGEPGLQAQVDWGNFQIANTNGIWTTKYLFLLVLGFSLAMYLEFVDSCSLETFLDCHQREVGAPCTLCGSASGRATNIQAWRDSSSMQPTSWQAPTNAGTAPTGSQSMNAGARKFPRVNQR